MSQSDTTPVTLADLVSWGKAKSAMSARQLARPIGAVWMDSRKVQKGDVFVALQGETGTDGHAYVKTALKAGAAAAIVARRSLKKFGLESESRLIVAADPLKALHGMALQYRRRLNIPLVAVTGSNGKTTTRRFISAVLASRFAVGETGGNWNNHIGVPLSILRFDGHERIAVLEMGANHVGEIHLLSQTAQPDIGVITNIGYAHVGNFGGLDMTTQAKFEIADGLNPQDGFLLLNGDDRRLKAQARRRDIPAVFFGFSSGCDVRVEEVAVDRDGSTHFSVEGQIYRLSIPGRHFIYNALPAIFLGRHFGISAPQIAEVLASVAPDSLRGAISTKGGVRFIVDCYNANPSSMQSGIQLLADVTRGRRMKAIVGDMKELGRYSLPQHRALGKLLFQAGVHKAIVVGEYAGVVAEGAIKAGMKPASLICTANADEALAAARTALKPGDTVLLKGSRAVGLERVFERW